MEEADPKNLRKAISQDIEGSYHPITGQSPDHERFPSPAITKAPEKRLNEELTDRKIGNDESQLEMAGSFLGNIDREERDDKAQPQDRNGSSQSDQD